jgi:hypothetical protein
VLGKVRHLQLVCWHGGMDILADRVSSSSPADLPAHSRNQQMLDGRMSVQDWCSWWQVPQQLTRVCVHMCCAG